MLFVLLKRGFIGCVLLVLFANSDAQKTGSETNPYTLNPSPTTIAYGNYWSETPPALRIHSGDYVNVHTLITSNPERLEGAGVSPDMVEQELRDVQAVKDRGPGGHVLTGPIYIEEAEPGDVLEVRLVSINLAIPYGYNAIGQNGFLSDEIFDRNMRIIRLDAQSMTGFFADSIQVPLRPFFGSMGVAPPEEGAAGTAHHPGYTPATSITKNWWRVPLYISQCLLKVRCLKLVTGMPRRATAR